MDDGSARDATSSYLDLMDEECQRARSMAGMQDPGMSRVAHAQLANAYAIAALANAVLALAESRDR